MDLPERLDDAADVCNVPTANLLRTAAATLRVQANRIIELDREVEHLLSMVSTLGSQIERLETQLGYDPLERDK